MLRLASLSSVIAGRRRPQKLQGTRLECAAVNIQPCISPPAKSEDCNQHECKCRCKGRALHALFTHHSVRQ